jgi:hypothetical protein
LFKHDFTSVLFDCRQVADDLAENVAGNKSGCANLSLPDGHSHVITLKRQKSDVA